MSVCECVSSAGLDWLQAISRSIRGCVCECVCECVCVVSAFSPPAQIGSRPSVAPSGSCVCALLLSGVPPLHPAVLEPDLHLRDTSESLSNIENV